MMTEQLSKSARRRARRKKAQQGATPEPQADHQPEQPSTGPTGDGVPVTLSIPARHMEVIKWALGGEIRQQSLDSLMSQIVRQFIVSKMPEYREATGGGGSTVRRANFNPEA